MCGSRNEVVSWADSAYVNILIASSVYANSHMAVMLYLKKKKISYYLLFKHKKRHDPNRFTTPTINNGKQFKLFS